MRAIRLTYQRSRPTSIEKIAARYSTEYLQAFGLLEAEWNRLESLLFLIFYTMSGARIDKAHGIFFSQVNHRARREMIEAIAFPVLVRRPALYKEFPSLMRRLKNAAQKRNEMIHCLYEWDNGKPWVLWPNDSDLKNADILKELATRTQTIHSLYEDLAAFYVRLPRRRTLSPRSPILVRRRRA